MAMGLMKGQDGHGDKEGASIFLTGEERPYKGGAFGRLKELNEEIGSNFKAWAGKILSL